jgi:hypothetical protein
VDSTASGFYVLLEIGEVFGGVDAESGVGYAEAGVFGEGGGVEDFKIGDEVAPPDARFAVGDV